MIPENLVCDESGADSGSLTNFAIPVQGTKAEWATVANGGTVENTTTSALDGITIPADFRVQNAAGTKLDIEWTAYSATTGAYSFTVEDPSLSCSAGAEHYVYTKNSAQTASEETGIGSVWGAYTKGVWGLQQDPATAGTDEMLDSLGVADATDVNDPASIAAVFGQGVDFDGSADFITIGTVSTYPVLDPGTVDARWSLWARGADSDGFLFINYDSGATRSLGVRLVGSTFECWTRTTAGIVLSGTSWPSSGWHHIACEADRDGNQTAWLDGVQVDADSIASLAGESLDNGDPFLIGRRGAGSLYSGDTDEVRYSSGLYSSIGGIDWVRTEYNAYNSISTFSVPGTTESSGGASAAVVIRLTTSRR